MVNGKIVKLIQDTADSFTQSTGANYKQEYAGYEVIIYNEFTYEFKEDRKKKIEAIVKFGSATKNNDLEDKYSLSFVINIFSEQNGWTIAQSIFNDIFETLTRTYQNLDNYNSKIFFSSPTLFNEQVKIGNNFYSYLTMNGSVEYSKNVVLGSKYELSLDGTNYVEVKPRQPYTMKEASGGTDTNFADLTQITFSKQGNIITKQLTLIYEQKTGTTTAITQFNALFNKLLDECFGETNQKYALKQTIGSIVKTITNLECIRGQLAYDEVSGENILSLQFKVGA